MTGRIRTAGAADFDEAYGLLDTRSRSLHGVSEPTTDDLRRRWALPGFEGWVADDDGVIVGYASLDAAGELELVGREADTADALLARAEERARERGLPALGVTSSPEDTALAGVLGRHGFDHDRTILRMWRVLNGDLPASKWPDGLNVRSYEPGDAPAVKALLDEAYGGWDRDYVARPLDDWIAFMTEHDEFDPALWFLVERDGELIGCALHWRERRRSGWVKDLVVQAGERGNGLGTALLHQGFRAYAERGVPRVGLKVDASNPTGAPALYERLGFDVDRRYHLWLKRL